MNLNFELFAITIDLSERVFNNLNLDVSDSLIAHDFGTSTNTPTYRVSQLCKNFLDNVTLSDYTITYITSEDSLLSNLMDSDIYKTHKAIYICLASVLTECIAIYYYMDNDKSEFENITSSDIKNIRSNLKILCDWFGDYNKYWVFIRDLRVIDIALGYIQNQLSFLVNDINYSINNLD